MRYASRAFLAACAVVAATSCTERELSPVSCDTLVENIAASPGDQKVIQDAVRRVMEADVRSDFVAAAWRRAGIKRSQADLAATRALLQSIRDVRDGAGGITLSTAGLETKFATWDPATSALAIGALAPQPAAKVWLLVCLKLFKSVGHPQWAPSDELHALHLRSLVVLGSVDYGKDDLRGVYREVLREAITQPEQALDVRLLAMSMMRASWPSDASSYVTMLAEAGPDRDSGDSGDGHSFRGFAAQSRMARRRNDGTRFGFVRLAEVLGCSSSPGFELLRSSAAPAKLTPQCARLALKR